MTFAQPSRYPLGFVDHSGSFILHFIYIHMCVCGLWVRVATDVVLFERFYISLPRLTLSTRRFMKRRHKARLLHHILQNYYLDCLNIFTRMTSSQHSYRITHSKKSGHSIFSIVCTSLLYLKFASVNGPLFHVTLCPRLFLIFLEFHGACNLSITKTCRIWDGIVVFYLLEYRTLY